MMHHKTLHVHRLASILPEFSDSGIHVKQADTDLCSNEQDNHVFQEVRFPVLNDLQKILQVVLDKVKLHRTHTVSAVHTVPSSSRVRILGEGPSAAHSPLLQHSYCVAVQKLRDMIWITCKDRTLSSSAS